MYAFLKSECRAEFINDVTTTTGKQSKVVEMSNNVGYVDGVGLSLVFSQEVPIDLKHLSKKKQKKEMKKRHFAKMKLENPKFSMRNWRKISRTMRESHNKPVQDKRKNRRDEEKVDRFMYNPLKHGTMPTGGHVVVTLANAEAVQMNQLSAPTSATDYRNVSSSSSSSSFSSSRALQAPSFPSELAVRTLDGRVRSLSCTTMQTIAEAYSDPTKHTLFIEKMKTHILKKYGGQKGLFNFENNKTNARSIAGVKVEQENGENDRTELERYNELHRKRTKLRQNVKKMIQKMNPGTMMDDVVLYDEL